MKQQADHRRVTPPVNKVPRVLIAPMRPWWANDQYFACLKAKMVSKNLIWSESAQWLRSSLVRKYPGALFTPMGMSIMPSWANDHDVAHLQAKAVPMNLIGIESAQWLMSFGIHKIPGALITPLMPPWGNDHDVAHLQAKTVPMTLIWIKWALWLLSFGVHKIPGALIMPMDMPIMAPTGKWS